MRPRYKNTIVLAAMACLLAGACTPTTYELRPTSAGFVEADGVADPYRDGKRQLEAGRFGLATQRFRQALAQDRSSIDVLNGLAVAYAGLGRTPLAEIYLQRALDLRHDDVATLNNYGRLLLEQGRLQEARLMLDLAARSASGADQVVVDANRALLQPDTQVAGKAPLLPPVRLERAALTTFQLRTGTAATTPGGPAAHAPAAPPLAIEATFSTAPISRSRVSTAEVEPFVVVANALGVNGLAATWRRQLAESGIRIGTIANAPSFGHSVTEIRYRPVFAGEAKAIAAQLPASARLIADPMATGDIYVALGLDSLELIGEPA